jgi:hypothetical protein
MGTKFDYDLNIFQREYEVPDQNLEDPSQGTVWEYQEPWYIHLYEVDAHGHEELGEPIELTESEANNLIKNDSYFDDEVDTWYGLEGFYKDKHALLSERLKSIFDALPSYKEEVLF